MRLLVPVTAAAFLLVSCAALTPAALPEGDGVLRLYRPGAASVQVVGDWNDWGGILVPGGVLDPSAGEMTRTSQGWWVADPPSGRGRFRYAFVVDGSVWLADPANPETALFGDRVVSVLVKAGG